MAEFYKHDSKEACDRMAVDYDASQKIESRAKGDSVTMHWAQPQKDDDGVWYLQKPTHLECSSIARCYPNAVIVDGADITWPEPEGLEEP